MAWGTSATMRRSVAFMAGLALANVLLIAAVSASGAEAPAEPTDAETTELARLRDFLTGPDRTAATRRDAAAGLLDKNSDAARTILLEVLSTPSEASQAVLGVLAARSAADEAFIDPLFQLLRSDNETMRRSAALAFGAYQGNDKVLARLKDLVADSRERTGVRLAAVEALAQIVDKRSVAALVEATGDAQDEVAVAAAQALADMTGLAEAGASAPDVHRDWSDWWQHHKDEPEADFLRGLVRRFRTELRQRETALNAAESRLARLLKEIYEGADTKEKARLIQEHLDDSLTQVRVVAVRQATALAREVFGANDGSQQTYQELRSALLKHVGDEAPAVRAASAEALAAWQETAAGPTLLARLDTEKSPEVRAALAAALGALKTGEAVPELVAMLDSPSQVEVIKSAGALGAIGDRSALGAAAVESALDPLRRLARTSPDPLVREAACRSLAKIAHASAEPVLAAALEDKAAGVRFSAVQGLGNLGRVAPETVEALSARLQDENKGVRQAAAATLAKLGGPAAARRMAERLKAGAEADPGVRNALWTAVQALATASETPDLAQELGDLFFALEGTEMMQRATALYEIAQTKYPASAAGSLKLQVLLEKLVDATVAAGTPEKAAPVLRQLLADTPAENPERRGELKERLGLILLSKGPYPEAAALLADVMDDREPAARAALVQAIVARAEALLEADRPEQALGLLDAFKKARPDWGVADQAAVLDRLKDRATDATIAWVIANLNGSEERVGVATATLKRVGWPAVVGLLDAIERAVKESRPEVEARILAALEAVSPPEGGTDRAYDPKAPQEERLKQIAAWREALGPTPNEEK
ncbi:MAG TPA: HEAT repeat domain-containing protein [Phycisphaerae bacterium]|nr:HEAT repeat domain-containing protein [Phycisphaerae bacterium]